MKIKILLLLCFPIAFSWAQIRFDVKNVEQIYEGNNSYSFNITIFVQNLGATTQINSLLNDNVQEWKSRGLSTTYYEEIADFFIVYKNPFSGVITSKIFPASITVKTIFNNYIPMSWPEYVLSSTGANSGQEWDILNTNIPKGAFDIFTKILGDFKQLSDLPGSEEIKEMLINKNKKLLEDAEFEFSKGNYLKVLINIILFFIMTPKPKINML